MKFFKGTVLKSYGTAMGSKTAVAYANIFMSKIETKIISKSKFKPLEWKRYIDDVFFPVGHRKASIKSVYFRSKYTSSNDIIYG